LPSAEKGNYWMSPAAIGFVFERVMSEPLLPREQFEADFLAESDHSLAVRRVIG
jgi:hypothetical protein